MIAHAPLAHTLTQFLDKPTQLHLVMTFLHKLLFDVHASLYYTPGPNGGHPGGHIHIDNGLPLYDCPPDMQEEVAYAAWHKALGTYHPALPADVKSTLRAFDVIALWRYLRQQWASQHRLLGTPDRVSQHCFAGSRKPESVVTGKLFLLNCALLHMRPDTDQWETLTQLVKPQPTCHFQPPNWTAQMEHSVPGGFFELNEALKRYLTFPYTMDDAPLYYTWKTLPGEVGYNNIFARAHNGGCERRRIEYPRGAPLSRKPREEAIVQVLRYFMCIAVCVCDMWIFVEEEEEREPRLWEYRRTLEQTRELLDRELGNPFSLVEEGVKQHLASLDLRAAFAYIWGIVRGLRRTGDEVFELEELEWQVHKWLVEAATLESEDPRGTIRRVIERRFDIPSEVVEDYRPRGFRHVGLDFAKFENEEVDLWTALRFTRESELDEAEMYLFDLDWETEMLEYEIASFHRRAWTEHDAEVGDATELELELPLDDDLVAVGDRINASLHSDPARLDPDVICTLCQYPLNESPNEDERGTRAAIWGELAVKLRKCPHSFHLSCLDELVNSTAANSNRCPTCRAVICKKRRTLPRDIAERMVDADDVSGENLPIGERDELLRDAIIWQRVLQRHDVLPLR
jgi:hypothetical protein